MTFRVLIYCPDRHIVYDGETPYRRGVGGGITARVRMANALSRAGLDVTAVVNCPRSCEIRGVRYVPLEDAGWLSADIVILTTSGDRLDLTPALKLGIEAGLRIVWVHGVTQPAGLDAVQPDFVYAVSNFIAGIARHTWGVPSDRVFVTYNGYEEDLFRQAQVRAEPRDSFRLLYFSHPSKGLETALSVLRLLRADDPRFHLKVFGSEALWGQEASPRVEEDGVTWGGLVGQEELMQQLLLASHSFHLQDREEPFGLALLEAMKAGCVAIASPVGCYPEMIRDGENGILIPGDHRGEGTRAHAARRILELSSEPDKLNRLSRAAARAPWSTDRMADSWTAHWDWWLRGRPLDSTTGVCLECSGPTLFLADGEHCLRCSSYRAVVSEAVG